MPIWLWWILGGGGFLVLAAIAFFGGMVFKRLSATFDPETVVVSGSGQLEPSWRVKSSDDYELLHDAFMLACKECCRCNGKYLRTGEDWADFFMKSARDDVEHDDEKPAEEIVVAGLPPGIPVEDLGYSKEGQEEAALEVETDGSAGPLTVIPEKEPRFTIVLPSASDGTSYSVFTKDGMLLATLVPKPKEPPISGEKAWDLSPEQVQALNRQAAACENDTMQL